MGRIFIKTKFKIIMDDKMTTLIRLQIKQIIMSSNSHTIDADVDKIEILVNKRCKEFGNFITRERYVNSFNALFNGEKPKILTTEQYFEKFKEV